MRATRFLRVSVALASLTLVSRTAGAQDAVQDAAAVRQQIDQLRREFDERMAALEARLTALEGGRAASPATPAVPPGGAPAPGAPSAQAPGQPTAEVPAGAEGGGGPTGALPVYGNASAASKIFNPDMAVIGNFLGAAGKNEVRPDPALEMRESEVSFQAIVDPYARADFFLSFGEQGVNLEEGFVTFPTLPGGLLLKVGRMRAAFGKVNTLHTHVLPWPDRPLVAANLVGGEDGISDSGMSIARLIPNPWIFLEATGQMFRGDSDNVFQSNKRGDLSYVGHLRGYHDISESTNLDLGASYAYGHNGSGVSDGVDIGRFTTDLFGVDATLR